ncbi:MAG TPA: D-hexose-6-phosphate mutarotase [Burkholderiales bacterium]|nr:D-hexose-6-phosphate mutarotase [Burkholderiales bacterium]
MKEAIETIDFHGLEALRLTAPSGASAIVSLYGAQVLSWTTPDKRERLFLSDAAVFDMQTAIRGGMPISFPQFSGLGDLPKHGFLRKHLWTVTERNHRDGYVMVSLACRDDDATRRIWPHSFSAELSVALEAARLDVELSVENIGDGPFAFTAALHTYLQVDEVENAVLEGLYGFQYRDALDGDKIKKDSGPTLHVSGPIDRVYHDANRSLLLRDGQHSLGIQNEGFPDTVIWNPWEALCAELPDMPKLGFRHMLCVEAAAAQRPVSVQPGETWWGRQTLVAL